MENNYSKNYYSKKSIWKWILLYVIIGVVAYVAIYYFYFYKKGGYNYNPQNYQTNTQNETADLSAKDLSTADWKTYKNDEYGFEMQIPTHWIIDKTPGSAFEFTTKDLEDAQLKNLENCKNIKVSVSCDAEFRGSIGIFQHFNRIVDLKDAFKISKVNLNQIEWTRYEVPSIDQSINYVIVKNNASYNFEIFNSRDEDSLIKILSTFTFTK